MLIERSGLARDSLAGFTVLITGAGGGIGLETARALAWLGASVIIAEIDQEKGAGACDRINAEYGDRRAEFHAVDLADPVRIERLHADLVARHGHVDAIINNATIAPIGAIDELDAETWDRSYAVNLRAPALLARLFLPDMKRRNRGTLVFVPSSGAAPYMGAYEVFKTAQVELCNTLAAELEGTGVVTYAIGPGLVPTDTAKRAIAQVARRLGMTEPEFYRMNANHMLDAEAAGTGFALSIVHADRYHGQEIGSIQTLLDAGIRLSDENPDEAQSADATADGVTTDAEAPADAEASAASEATAAARPVVSSIGLAGLMAAVQRTYQEQYDGWMTRSLFERQWVLRDFRKTVGHSADQFRDSLMALKPVDRFDARETGICRDLLTRLKAYYQHQYKLLQGYEKNVERLQANSAIIQGWIRDLDAVFASL